MTVKLIAKITKTRLNKLLCIEGMETMYFDPKPGTTFGQLIELEDLLNKMSDDFTGFEVFAEREDV